MQTRSARVLSVLLLAGVVVGGCSSPPEPASRSEIAEGMADARDEVREPAAAWAAVLQRASARADSVEEALRPVPLLRPAEEQALRRYGNDEQLVAARRLGVDEPPTGAAEVEALRRAGTLVPLDSTEHWVVRELDHSHARVTPDTRALLAEIGERFQAELADLGLPPYRLEVTSALRTAEQQAALRGVNVNAARGRSTHEFGTTVDLAYSGFAAPAEPVVHLPDAASPEAAASLRQLSDAVLERAAARKSRELQAILGRVLREMQEEGDVLVTLERLQPVYHLTVARPF